MANNRPIAQLVPELWRRLGSEQRGLSENTSRLRQYLHRGTDLPVRSQANLRAIAGYFIAK